MLEQQTCLKNLNYQKRKNKMEYTQTNTAGNNITFNYIYVEK